MYIYSPPYTPPGVIPNEGLYTHPPEKQVFLLKSTQRPCIKYDVCIHNPPYTPLSYQMGDHVHILLDGEIQ